MKDIIVNGRAHGDVASVLLENGFDVAALRPWKGNDGRTYVGTRNSKGELVAQSVFNANATLRKDEWIQLDEAVVQAAKERLRLVADLRSRGLVYNIPNGMAKTVLETQNASDISPATVSMDPTRQSENDRPEFDLTALPLPVIHKDFWFNARQLAAGRNSGMPIDTLTAQLAARRVAEEAEKLAIGNGASVDYGGGKVYGMTNFPNRITSVSVGDPTDSGWNGKKLLSDILKMRQASIEAKHYGPWVLYVGKGWDQYLDEDYSDNKGDNTVRERLRAIDGIQDIISLDYMASNDLVLCQQTSDVIRQVVGMDITTVQWETMGGMRINFKVMAILVPQLRADFYGNTGIVHATVS